MRLEAISGSSTSTSISTTAPTTSPLTSTFLISGNNHFNDHNNNINNNNSKQWVRARRQTDPFSRTAIPEIVHPARRSVDSSPRAATTDDYHLGRKVPRTPSLSKTSTISTDGLSNPALGGFTPRKINALKNQASPARNNPSLIPTLTPTRSFPSSLPTLKVSPTTTITRDEPDNDDDDNDNVPPLSPSAHAAANSYFNLQSTLSGAEREPRSPQQKRGPASRSSYGIETSSGPPPALSTQRTLSQDRLWRSNTSPDPPNSSQSPEPQPNGAVHPPFSIDAVLKSESEKTSTADQQQQLSTPPEQDQARPETEEKDEVAAMDSRFGRNSYGGNDRDRTIRGADYMNNTETSSRDSSNEEGVSKNEDLFLNIAKSTSDRRESGRSERRRSKFGIPTFSSRTIRASEQTPSPEQTRYHSDQVTPLQSQNASPSVQYNSSNKPSPATSHPLDEVGRLRYFGVTPRTSIGYPRTRLNRKSRETSPESPRTTTERRGSFQEHGQTRGYRQSNLSATRNNLQQSNLEAPEHVPQEAEKSRLDGTESTLSTTAPSTVWDELDDLKSRIRKLELTGKLPTSSAAAMSQHASGERPRTATTTVTTMSSSPKHGRKATTPPPEPEQKSAINQIRPLLHSALEKAKPILSNDVFKALEATATDALTLANMLDSSGPQSNGTSVVNGGSANSERQARRKADSMCRSLTELCLALSDEKLISLPNPRPGSRDTASNLHKTDNLDTESTTPTISYRRSASHEPEDMRWAQNNRAPSHLESRRASRLSINTAGGSRLSQDTNNQTIPTPTHATPPNRLNRASTTLRSRRAQGEDDSEERQSFLSRPISRAMTEIGNPNASHQRFSPRDRTSFQHQPTIPDQEQSRNPSLAQSAIPLRRNYVSPSTQLPTASHTSIQPGSRRYGGASNSSTPGTATTGIPSYDGPADDSPLQRQSQLRGPSTSTARNVGRFSDVQPLRSRTNSVGTRRFGIRSRQVTMNADSRDGIGAGTAE